MKALFLTCGCIALAGCGNNRPTALSQDLKRGMTEQQLAEVRGGRVPDRIIMLTCGAETAHPFPCKVYVYEGSGLFDRKLSVVLEDYGGQWKVSQWL
jgi:hypothetical protein